MAIDKITTPAVTDSNITSGKIADDAITLAKMAPGTDGNIISYDASGNPVAVATGSAGQVLTSAGAGAPPTFSAVAANAGTLSFEAYRSGDLSVSATTQTEIVFNAVSHNSGGSTPYNTSTGRYTPGVAGTYFVAVNVSFDPSGNQGANQSMYLKIRKTNNSDSIEHGQISFSGTGGQNVGLSTAAVISLGASDYISCWWYNSEQSGTLLSVQSYFSGFRIA